MKAVAKDLVVGTEYWLDDTNQVSGVCVEIDTKGDTIRFNKVPGQPDRYATDVKGRIIFPVYVPYEYVKVEA